MAADPKVEDVKQSGISKAMAWGSKSIAYLPSISSIHGSNANVKPQNLLSLPPF